MVATPHVTRPALPLLSLPTRFPSPLEARLTEQPERSARIPKALRFQILRRDNHACRYCGASAPEATLVVDHVLPVALGGETTAENLVTACVACNSGKAATPPDAATVADVQADALRWREAMEFAAGIQRAIHERRERYIEAFDAAWSEWKITVQGSDTPIDRDDNWRASIGRFRDLGLNEDLMLEMVTRAMTKPGLQMRHVWKYFCGCCWRVLRERTEIAQGYLGIGDEE